MSTYREAVLIPRGTGGNSSRLIPIRRAILLVRGDTFSADLSPGTDTFSGIVSSRIVSARARLRHTSETHATLDHPPLSPHHHLVLDTPSEPSRTTKAQSSTRGLIRNRGGRGVRMREIEGGEGGFGLLLPAVWGVLRGDAAYMVRKVSQRMRKRLTSSTTAIYFRNARFPNLCVSG